MAQTLRLKRSSVAGRVPTTGSLQTGEIAINTADGLVYIRKDDNSIIPLLGVNTAPVTGSVVLQGGITATSFTGSFTGNFSGSINNALTALYAELANNATYIRVQASSINTPHYVNFSLGTGYTSSIYSGPMTYNPATNTLTVTSITGSITNATTASYALNAGTAQTATTASYALIAQQVLNLETGSFLATGSISGPTITLTKVNGTSFNLVVNNVASASFATTASYAINAANAVSASFSSTAATATSASYATTASFAILSSQATTAVTATSASYAATASYTLIAQQVLGLDTGSFVTTGSVSNATITLDQADGTSFNLTVNNVANATSASYASVAETALNVDTGSLLVTGSVSNATITLTKGNGTSFGLTVNNVANATSALTASSADSFAVRNNATVAGNLTVEGKVTAQEFHTEFVSASIVYSSGSTKFGDTLDDVHQFTGSVAITGSLNSPDITINQWGSVSASLASISTSANALTLQQVTTNGNVTTNSITISSSLYVSQSVFSKGEDVLDFAIAVAIALG